MTVTGCAARKHGTASAYNNHRCQCPGAREKHLRQAKRAKYLRGKGIHGRQDRVPILGTQRRIRALTALGWPAKEQTAMCGVAVSALLYGDRTTTTVATARRVARMYDDLCMTEGPSAQSRKRAAYSGVAPPLAWDDIDDPNEQPKHRLDCTRGRIPRERMADDVVEAAFAWRRPRMSFTEYHHVVDVAIDDRGMAIAEIADMLGVSREAVQRTRTRSNAARTAARRKARRQLAVAS